MIPPPATIPNAIAFWDARHGIAGTGLQWRGLDRLGGTVTLTGDGGRTWRVVLRTRRPVVDAGIAGREGAWVETDRGAVLRSADRGRTWRRAGFGKAFGPSFADARHGLALWRRPHDFDGPAGVVATADGGRTWSPRASPCRGAVSSTAYVALVTPRRGWLLCNGQGGAGNMEKAVYRTDDGGRSWHATAEAIFYPHKRVHGGIGSYGYPLGIAMGREGRGVIWESRGYLYVTKDGGTHWRAAPVAGPEIDFGQYASVAGGRIFVLLARGGQTDERLLVSANAGRTWRLVRRWRS